ncbi:MAG: prenyltransferase/squalene oxidase repeat-containing protein [Planctomycetaceae bacterium]
MLAGLICLLFTGLPLDHTEEIKFVQKMQTPSGGFITDLPVNGTVAEPTLRTTRTGIRALKLLGGEIPNREALIRFLNGCYHEPSGGFSARPGLPPDPISTSVGLMIHKELGLPYDDILPRALQYMNEQTSDFEQIRMVAPCLDELRVTVSNTPKWASRIADVRNSDGAYGSGPGKARTTALHAMAAIRLGQDVHRDAVLSAMRQGQRADGGFGNDAEGGSDLESCYRVIRVFRRLDEFPDRTEDVMKFVALCRNDDGGFGRTPDEPSSLHGTYYATIIRLWLRQTVTTFDETGDNELPIGWKTASNRNLPDSEWKVVTAADSASGKVLAQGSGSGRKTTFNLCITNLRYGDAQLSVKVRPISGTIDQGGGLVWRYRDSRNYYITRWNPLEQNLRLYKVVNGVRSQLDTAPVAGHTGEQHELRVVCVGRDLRVYFDDTLMLEAEDDEFKDMGAIGFWTKADAVTQFDDLASRYAEHFEIEDLVP